MYNPEAVLALADTHFTLHLLAPGEADVPASNADDAAAPAGAADAGAAQPDEAAESFLPENLVEDLVDEIIDMLDDIAENYNGNRGWEQALVYGFLDGALAVADGTWSSLEDSYYEDASNPDFADADAAIDDIVAEFEGSRPWDETAKGFVRSAVANAEADPAASGAFPWNANAHAFIYGLEAAYDLEWKFVVTPAHNLLLTDEDCLQEAAAAQLAAQSGGSLLDRVFDMMGIDPDALAEAIDHELGEDEEDDDSDEPLEGELEVVK